MNIRRRWDYKARFVCVLFIRAKRWKAGSVAMVRGKVGSFLLLIAFVCSGVRMLVSESVRILIWMSFFMCGKREMMQSRSKRENFPLWGFQKRCKGGKEKKVKWGKVRKIWLIKCAGPVRARSGAIVVMQASKRLHLPHKKESFQFSSRSIERRATKVITLVVSVLLCDVVF